MAKIKTVCLWCGKSHKGKVPIKCQRSARIMSAVCKKVDVWKAMRVLEVYGTKGLEQLAVELKVKVAS